MLTGLKTSASITQTLMNIIVRLPKNFSQSIPKLVNRSIKALLKVGDSYFPPRGS